MTYGLNDQQKEAVLTLEGPLLILAGAGSGKTKTLTHRIAYLLHETDITSDEILAVTFTNKAAKEMRMRLAELLNRNPDSYSFMPYMGTFHGICVRLLREDGESIGVARNFVIYDESDKQGLIKSVAKKLGIKLDSGLKARTVASMISSAKNEAMSVKQYAELAYGDVQKKVARIYKEYEISKNMSKALDFDDILLEALRMFERSTTIREKWQKKFRHIMIDEYQDTNNVQYRLIKLLVNEKRNICVVGDDWQSIYSWRGADFRNILNFEHDFTGAKVIKLEQNYRSTGSILKGAASVINKNKNRTTKHLWTDCGDGMPIKIIACRSDRDEAAKVASLIQDKVLEDGRDFSHFAVLYRTNAQSRDFEDAFIARGIKYKIVGGLKFYDRKEIKDLIAYLRLIYQPDDSASFARIVNSPKRGLGAVGESKLEDYRYSNNLNYIDALLLAENISGLQAKTKANLIKLGEALRDLNIELKNGAKPSEILEALIKKVDYELEIKNDLAYEERMENIGSLISSAESYVSVDDFLAYISLSSSSDLESEKGSVTLITVHAAKGLEFKVVFLVGMEEGIFPSAMAEQEGEDGLEEERRLCYVGMTRAEEELYMTYASSRLRFGNITYSDPSRFVSDAVLGGAEEVKKNSNVLSLGRTELVEDIYDREVDLEIGTRVRSPSFGVGVVKSIDGVICEIYFSDHGLRKLNLEYAYLEKI